MQIVSFEMPIKCDFAAVSFGYAIRQLLGLEQNDNIKTKIWPKTLEIHPIYQNDAIELFTDLRNKHEAWDFSSSNCNPMTGLFYLMVNGMEIVINPELTEWEWGVLSMNIDGIQYRVYSPGA